MGEPSADRVVVAFGDLGAECCVEVLDLGRRQDTPRVGPVGEYRRLAPDVVLVLNRANDLLKDIFERDQSGDAAVLVDHDRKMVAVDAELLQKHVQALGLRDEDGRPHEIAQRQRGADDVAQEVFGHDHADDVVARTLENGES